MGDNILYEALEQFRPAATVLSFDLKDPRYLGLAARDWLISHSEPADLNIYLEDDLVIHDPLLPEKFLWIAKQSNHSCVLFPHRYELIQSLELPTRLYIDGPSNHDDITSWHQPLESAASGRFCGRELLTFDVPSNPHSGFFALSRQQTDYLACNDLAIEGFVGPLETAATHTVGRFFKLLKPALNCREFLTLEHAHPSYLGYLFPFN
ncbi:hypothetical protein [Synechococcus sp. M16CYN]|uniref:hypothetical protein n=1 Tax=Synechococcus sp. M16CYN TaxID=3103139 RepID=UPI0030E20B25